MLLTVIRGGRERGRRDFDSTGVSACLIAVRGGWLGNVYIGERLFWMRERRGLGVMGVK